MNLQELAAAGDVNLASAWAALGRAAGYPVKGVDSLTLTASGLPLAFFNGAFCAGPTDDPTGAVRGALEFFAEHHVPALMWVRDGLDDDLLAAGRAAGFTDAGGPPAMALADIPEVPLPPAGLTLSVATDRADVQAHRDVLSAGFGFPPEVATRVIGDALLDDPDVAIIIGRVAGEAVTTGLLMRTGSTAGVNNIATVDTHRGRRLGEAVTWGVIAEGVSRGCDHSILQSSEMGHSIYRRMGFVDVGRYVQLAIDPGSLDPGGPPAA